MALQKGWQLSVTTLRRHHIKTTITDLSSCQANVTGRLVEVYMCSSIHTFKFCVWGNQRASLASVIRLSDYALREGSEECLRLPKSHFLTQNNLLNQWVVWICSLPECSVNRLKHASRLKMFVIRSFLWSIPQNLVIYQHFSRLWTSLAHWILVLVLYLLSTVISTRRHLQ